MKAHLQRARRLARKGEVAPLPVFPDTSKAEGPKPYQKWIDRDFFRDSVWKKSRRPR